MCGAKSAMRRTHRALLLLDTRVMPGASRLLYFEWRLEHGELVLKRLGMLEK